MVDVLLNEKKKKNIRLDLSVESFQAIYNSFEKIIFGKKYTESDFIFATVEC